MKNSVKELRDLSSDELQAKAAELKKEMFNLRVQQAMGQIENPMRLRILSKDIAKTKTVLKEKYGRV